METKWIIIALVVVCAIALVIYLIISNQKDKEEVIRHFNESEFEDEPRLKE